VTVSVVQPFSQLVRHALEYLWLNRIALGKLTMLDGDPEQGKSLVALDLCARLSTGRCMPDGTPGIGVANSLILQDEDGAEDTVFPRLQAVGADLTRVFRFHPDDGTDDLLRFPDNFELLDTALQESDARLLVLDPVTAFLDSSVMLSSDQSVRRALSPLARLASKHRCAVKMVRHINKKQGGTNAMYRGLGSIGLVAACRSAWIIGRDPQHPQRRVVAQIKNNLAPPQPSLAYELVTQANAPPTIAWLGETPWTSAQLLGAGLAPAPMRDRAEEFLSEFLKDGPRTSREIWTAAQKRHLSDITLRRARKKLELPFRRVYREGVPYTYWLLPDQELPPETGPPREPTELEIFLDEQKKKFPPRCPLDDE
jgi:hypothetical protein